jgi:hypothetical protein
LGDCNEWSDAEPLIRGSLAGEDRKMVLIPDIDILARIDVNAPNPDHSCNLAPAAGALRYEASICLPMLAFDDQSQPAGSNWRALSTLRARLIRFPNQLYLTKS